MRYAVALTGILGGALLIFVLPPLYGEPAPKRAPANAAGDRDVPRLPATSTFVQRLQSTNLLNGVEVYDRLGLATAGSRARTGGEPSGRGRDDFLTRNPYELALPVPDAGVCAVAFVDTDRVDYRLHTFPHRETALAEGGAVTHVGHCGTCSSLGDLSVYLANPDLTSPARSCARRLTRRGVKACLMDAVGFGEACAEAWTYNVLHTRRRCATTCIRHYGLWRVLRNDMGDFHADERANLNPCLACDERVSGPGFKYAAGRTRRNSGLASAIPRPPDEVHLINHGLYFE